MSLNETRLRGITAADSAKLGLHFEARTPAVGFVVMRFIGISPGLIARCGAADLKEHSTANKQNTQEEQ